MYTVPFHAALFLSIIKWSTGPKPSIPYYAIPMSTSDDIIFHSANINVAVKLCVGSANCIVSVFT